MLEVELVELVELALVDVELLEPDEELSKLDVELLEVDEPLAPDELLTPNELVELDELLDLDELLEEDALTGLNQDCIYAAVSLLHSPLQAPTLPLGIVAAISTELMLPSS